MLTVIVAEDEFLIRMIAAEALIDAGYRVIEVEHSAAALRILQTGADQVSALFTDINMPGKMDGLTLAHHAHAHWPWIKLLITSGAARVEVNELPLGGRFVAKPYEMVHLIRNIREMTVDHIGLPPLPSH